MDASLFTTDTTTPCDYNISPDILNSDKLQENKKNTTQPMGIHSQNKHKYRNVFDDSNIQYHNFDNGDGLTFKDKYTTLLQQELNYKTLIGVCTIQLQSKAIKYLLKWT